MTPDDQLIEAYNGLGVFIDTVKELNSLLYRLTQFGPGRCTNKKLESARTLLKIIRSEGPALVEAVNAIEACQAELDSAVQTKKEGSNG